MKRKVSVMGIRRSDFWSSLLFGAAHKIMTFPPQNRQVRCAERGMEAKNGMCNVERQGATANA